ncbi:hypothetical protein OKW98_03560 [Pseudomonas sp. KU26590]|uniref:hypothetical protein n=1 Tax=Pseudomonas sp. KU26590 TaxID=2991051 RepID=UPI00223CE74D|nr:hypothetical protein [Pseudomonas sp. KU26590]UZJ60831.1 hypothetical protein OKW98_03560 [Pseudomonas sp. KU26590]
MQTVRQYLHTSVKKIALTIASVIIFSVFFFAADWALSGKFHNGLIIAGLSFASELSLPLGLAILSFFGYKATKIIREEKSPRQEFVKMIPAASIWLSILLLTINFFAGRSITDCQKFNYNNTLNGGIKEFNGKQYTVNICGSGVSNSHFFGDGLDAVQLTIIDDKGDELAKRSYKVSWDTQPGHEPLTTEKDSITYQDDEDQRSYIISMPPTLIDRIQARVPLFRIWE